MMSDQKRNRAVKQTELERLQNEVVSSGSADKPKQRGSDAKTRMLEGARRAAGPKVAKGDWRWRAL